MIETTYCLCNSKLSVLTGLIDGEDYLWQETCPVCHTNRWKYLSYIGSQAQSNYELEYAHRKFCNCNSNWLFTKEFAKFFNHTDTCPECSAAYWSFPSILGMQKQKLWEHYKGLEGQNLCNCNSNWSAMCNNYVPYDMNSNYQSCNVCGMNYWTVDPNNTISTEENPYFSFDPEPEETATRRYSIMNYTDTLASIQNFYALVELDEIFSRNRACGLSVKRELATYSKYFAHQLFDYLAVICIGEARWATKYAKVYCPSLSQNGYVRERDEIYKYHDMINPMSSAPALSSIFSSEWKDGGYGGTKWACLVNLYTKYGTIPDHLFIDMVVNKQHNNGSVFNKPILFDVVSSISLQTFLNFRRECDVLSYTGYLHLTSSVISYINEAVKLNMINEPLFISPCLFVNWQKPLEWGFITLEAEDNEKITYRARCEYCGEYEDYCSCSICKECECKEAECTCSWCPDCDHKDWDCQCEICPECGEKLKHCTCDEPDPDDESDDEPNPSKPEQSPVTKPVLTDYPEQYQEYSNLDQQNNTRKES